METHMMHYRNCVGKPWSCYFSTLSCQNSHTDTLILQPSLLLTEILSLPIISIPTCQPSLAQAACLSTDSHDSLKVTAGATFLLHFGWDVCLQMKSWKIGGCRGTVCAGGFLAKNSVELAVVALHGKMEQAHHGRWRPVVNSKMTLTNIYWWEDRQC